MMDHALAEKENEGQEERQLSATRCYLHQGHPSLKDNEKRRERSARNESEHWFNICSIIASLMVYILLKFQVSKVLEIWETFPVQGWLSTSSLYEIKASLEELFN